MILESFEETIHRLNCDVIDGERSGLRSLPGTKTRVEMEIIFSQALHPRL